MTGSSAQKYIVPGLVRGLHLLELFDREHSEWNVAELAAAAGLPHSTTYRLVATLEQLGFIERIRNRKLYRLGARVLNLGFAYLGSQDIVETALEPLQTLSAATGGSTHLGILDGADVVYLLRIAGPNRLVSNVRVGTRLPAHATVMGHALLSDHPIEDLRVRFGDRPLEAATKETATTATRLFEQIRAEQEQGYALSVAGFEVGISSAGAPVRDASGQIVAAINFIGPEAQFDNRRLIAKVVGPVCETAAEISRRMGYRAAVSPRAAE